MASFTDEALKMTDEEFRMYIARLIQEAGAAHYRVGRFEVALGVDSLAWETAQRAAAAADVALAVGLGVALRIAR